MNFSYQNHTDDKAYLKVVMAASNPQFDEKTNIITTIIDLRKIFI